METPTLEFYDTVGVQSAIEEQQLFKLLDQDGKTLVLRPDMTGPIARVAASKLLKHGHPLRVGYAANVFRAQEREGGRPAEFEQVGVELIGDGTTSADAEVIALVVGALKTLGWHPLKLQLAMPALRMLCLLRCSETLNELMCCGGSYMKRTTSATESMSSLSRFPPLIKAGCLSSLNCGAV